MLIPVALLACSPSAPEAPAQEHALPEIPARGDDAARKSKNGHLVHEVDGVQVDVRYGRPEMGGRTIFGDLVPYGAIWRTGADEATTVAFSHDVRINRAPVPKGVYSLFTIPYAKEWVVVLNAEPKQWGAFEYDKAKDVLRVAVAAEEHEPTDTLTFEGTEQGIRLRWAGVAVPLTVAQDRGPEN